MSGNCVTVGVGRVGSPVIGDGKRLWSLGDSLRASASTRGSCTLPIVDCAVRREFFELPVADRPAAAYRWRHDDFPHGSRLRLTLTITP